MLIHLFISTVMAMPKVQLEWSPDSTWKKYNASEELSHPLSNLPQAFTPWLAAEQSSWRVRGAFLPYTTSQRSITTETTETYSLGHIQAAVAIDRLYQREQITWNAGVGVWYNHPIWSLQSNAFSDAEQDAIDSQNDVTQAAIRSIDVHLPLSVSTNVGSEIEFGIGITYHWMMQYSASDVERQWSHRIAPTPSIYVRL